MNIQMIDWWLFYSYFFVKHFNSDFKKQIKSLTQECLEFKIDTVYIYDKIYNNNFFF